MRTVGAAWFCRPEFPVCLMPQRQGTPGGGRADSFEGNVKSPAFSFYPDAFLGSYKVATMSAEEIGVYVLLLSLDWAEIGFKFEPNLLARWCRVSRKKFLRCWEKVAECFEERDGRMFNPRLDLERKRQAENRAKKQAAAKARWNAGADADADAYAMQTQCLQSMTLSRSLVTATASDTNVSGKPGELPTPDGEPPLPFGDLPPNLQREIESSLMGLVRTYLYCGRTPAGYDDARDVTILRQWLKRGRSRAEIADAIEGFAKARDRGDVHFLKRGERCTLRVLKNTKTGDMETWDLAIKAVFDD